MCFSYNVCNFLNGHGYMLRKRNVNGFGNRIVLVCIYCPYSTSHLGHMKYHKLKYSRAHPVECSICQRSFPQNLTYKNI